MARLVGAALTQLRGRRGAGVGAAVAVVIALLLVFRPAGDTGPVAGPEAAASPSATGASAPSSPTASASPSPQRSPRPKKSEHTGEDHDHALDYSPAPQTSAAAPAAAQIASDFARGWVQSALPADRWWAALAPLCESGFAQSLRATDPANVPARQVTGAATSTQSSNDLAIFLIPTDAGDLQVTVAHLEGAWRVTDNDWRPR